MSHLISIITVTKNCVSTIERTLKSIQEIKSADIQYIIIDGKSNDGTLLAIERYKHLVDILISEDDTGIYNAMNKGAMIAEGKYILFINGDDYILADGFNKAKIILKDDAPEILCCRSEAFSESGNKESTLFPSLWRLLFFNSIPHLSTFVSTNLQNKFKFREVFRIAADYDLFLRMFIAGHQFMMSEFVTSVHYRGGFSSNSVRSTAEVRLIRKDNLGVVLYFLTRWIEWLNKTKKVVIRKVKFF